MKLKLLCVLLFSGANLFAQILLEENFDSPQNILLEAGWSISNQSEPVGEDWSKASADIAEYFVGGAYNGDPETSFMYANFNSVDGSGTISNWLFTPVVNLSDGVDISFFSRKGLSGGEDVYADRLEMRISMLGAASDLPEGAEDVGDFTTLALTINPDLTLEDYPTEWTQFNYVVSGIPEPTECRIAFRYYVTDGGIAGSNSDYVGIDQLSVQIPLSTEDFFRNNISMYPNPSRNVVRFATRNGIDLISAQVLDMNGRLVGQSNLGNPESAPLDVSGLSSGIYTVKVVSTSGTGTAKLVKQ